MKKFIGLILLVGLVFIGCPNGNDDTNNTPSKLAIIDIANATNLFIAPASNGRTARAAGDTNKLFKITDEGYIQEVSYIDENGKTKTDIQTPSAIYNVNDDYVIICFGYDEGYLTRKSDGAVFLLNTSPSDNKVHIGNRESIFTDNGNNIYYLSNSKVMKTNIQNPNSLTQEIYSPQTDSVSGFVMDNQGNILYFGRDASSEISRIKKANNGLRNLASVEGRVAWIAQDNNFYYFKSSPFSQVQKLVIDTGYSDTISDFGSEIGFNNAISNLEAWVVNIKNRVVAFSRQNEVYEVYPTPSFIHYGGTYNRNDGKHNHFSLSSIKDVGYSRNYYYIIGNDTSSNPIILKVDPVNDTDTLVLSGYDVYKMTVTSDDIITFNALHMDNGRKVIGEISASGQMTILDETLDAEVIVLERIK